METGEKIRALRLKKNLSQWELGEKAGVPQTTISDWENSKSIPSADRLYKISKVLNVELTYLLDD